MTEKRVVFNPFNVIEDPTASTIDDLSPDLRMIFKRILKKDASTRRRGLEELLQWLGQCDEQEFEKIRAHFVDIFQINITDDDFDIRERTAATLKSLVTNPHQKKWLAPCVKEIIFTWLGALYDGGSVAVDAQIALDKCFGRDKYPVICKNVGLAILKQAETNLKDCNSTSMVIANTYGALTFLTEYCKDVEILSAITTATTLTFCLSDERLKIASSPIRHAYYRFVKDALSHQIISKKNNHVLNSKLFELILQDISGLGPKSARFTWLELLTNFEWTSELCQDFCMFIENNLNSLSRDEIIFLSNFIPLLSDKLLFSSLWNHLEKGKILDNSKILAIWRVVLTLLQQKKGDLIEKVVTDSLGSDKILSGRIMSEIVPQLYSLDPLLFMGSLKSMHQSRQVKVLACIKIDKKASVDTQALECLLNELSLNNQNELLERILCGPDQLDKTRFYMLETLLEKSCIWAEMVKRLLSCSSIVLTQEMLDRVTIIISTKLSELDNSSQTLLLSRLLRHPNYSWPYTVPTECGRLALESFSNPELQIVLWRYFDLPYQQGNSLKVNDLAALQELGIKAITGDKDSRSVFKAFCCFLLDIELIEKDVSPNILASFLAEIKIDQYHDLVIRLVQALIKYQPSIKALLFTKLLSRHHPHLLETLRNHIKYQTTALWVYPILWKQEDQITLKMPWTDSTILKLVHVLAVLLSYFPENEKLEEKLVLKTFNNCLQLEALYEEKATPLIPLSLFSEIPFKYDWDTLTGLYLLEAKNQNSIITLSNLLKSSTPIDMLIQDIEDDLTELSTELLAMEELKLMGAAVKISSWVKSKYFQLLCNIPPFEFFSTANNQKFCHIYVLSNFFNEAIRKHQIIKQEFWNHHLVHINGLLAILPKLCSTVNEIKTFSQIIRPLFLFTSLVWRHSLATISLNDFWKCFQSLTMLPPLPALRELINTACTALEPLISSLDRTIVADFDIVSIFLSSPWIEIKWTMREFLMRRMDLILEEARVKLPLVEASEDIIIPFDALKARLECPTLRSVIDSLLVMDAFLCFAEGSREEQALFSSFADYFQDKLCDIYLPLLINILGWFPDQQHDPIPLDRLEFTTIPIGIHFTKDEENDQNNNVTIMAANILFRLLKAFPGVIRTWYGKLDRGEATAVLRYCTLFMSPLLIERELSRLRKASIEPLKIRILQSSTSCSVQIDYRMEEFTLSFTLIIPPSFPLHATSVEGDGERLGVSESRWRSWLLSVQSLLSRNLSIPDAIRQWKANAEKVLQGIEACSICYCVLQPGDKSLPGPSCKTCRNKFHSVCLYRWFKTSGQASCPMCRSLF